MVYGIPEAETPHGSASAGDGGKGEFRIARGADLAVRFADELDDLGGGAIKTRLRPDGTGSARDHRALPPRGPRRGLRRRARGVRHRAVGAKHGTDR